MTSEELAARAGLTERYVREWLTDAWDAVGRGVFDTMLVVSRSGSSDMLMSHHAYQLAQASSAPSTIRKTW